MARTVCILICILAGCTAPGAPAPSLAPRAAEAIDPRVPVKSAVVIGAVDPTLSARLAGLVAEARNGNVAFEAAAGEAERVASQAGEPRSESWVAAQQALSAAVAAREPVTRALGDIDAIAAVQLAARGGIAPADLSAVQTAAAEVGEIDRRQAAQIEALQARLGS